MDTDENAAPESPSPEATPPPPTPPTQTARPLQKKPLLAALLSGFPGVGHVYNGLYLRGITFFIVAATGIYLVDRGGDIWIFAVFFIWIFNMLDAYRQATLINYGYAVDLGISDRPRKPKPGQGLQIVGVVLVIVGVLFFMDIHFPDFLRDAMDYLGPGALVALGSWFIYTSRKSKSEEEAADTLS